MIRRHRRIIRYLLIDGLYSIVPIFKFLFGRHGKDYRVGILRRLGLLFRFAYNNLRIETESTVIQHLTLLDELLKIPVGLQGDVIELGCYKGSSTVNLSFACAAVGRRLIICDSFAGLPEPTDSDKGLFNIKLMRQLHYKKGDFSGTLDEVRNTVAKYGRIDVCEFVPGFFENTLPDRKERYVLIFEDADLVSSVKTTLKFAWPRLQNGCKYFTHEARDYQIAMLFFDKEFWSGLSSSPPGLIGAGIGLPFSPEGSDLGYTVKGIQTQSS